MNRIATPHQIELIPKLPLFVGRAAFLMSLHQQSVEHQELFSG